MSLSGVTPKSSSAMVNTASVPLPGVLVPDLHVIFTAYDSPTFISSVNPFSRLLIKMLNSIMLVGRLYLEIHTLSFQFRFEKYRINLHFLYFVMF